MRRIASLIWSVPLAACCGYLFVAGLATGRVQLGTRGGIRGGNIGESWQRDPVMFVLAMAILSALALLGLVVAWRALRRR